MADLSIVIVTFNSSHVVMDCLKTITGLDGIEVNVYDNDSADDTVRAIRRAFPEVRVIEGPDNAGFAVAVNHAVAASDSPRVMLLNPDAVIEEASIRALMTSVDQAPLRIVAPVITHPHGLHKVASGGYFPTSTAMLAHYTGLSRLRGVRGHYLLLSDQARPVGWVSGACWMTTRATWDAVGGLSERWFMYAEDIDFCWRVAQLGGSALMEPSASATHLVGQSDKARSGAVNSMWVENLYDFYSLRMSGGRLSTLWWGVGVSGGLLLRSVVFNAQRRPGTAREFRAHSRAVLRCAASYVRRPDA